MENETNARPQPLIQASVGNHENPAKRTLISLPRDMYERLAAERGRTRKSLNRLVVEALVAKGYGGA